MIELLKEQLKEYTDKYDEALTDARRLATQGQDYTPVVKRAAGLKLLMNELENMIEIFNKTAKKNPVGFLETQTNPVEPKKTVHSKYNCSIKF